jgi:hypothetical protein
MVLVLGENLAQMRNVDDEDPVEDLSAYGAHPAFHLAAEHHNLMTQDHDLRVLARLATAQQDQPAEHPDHDHVQQTDRHRPRSCLNSPPTPNGSSKPMRRVLKRYTVYSSVPVLSNLRAGPLGLRQARPMSERRISYGATAAETA